MGLTQNIDAAMTKARYKLLEDGSYFGEIPGFRGVWAEAGALEACRKELKEVLEDWIVLKLREGDPLPAVDGRRIKVPTVAHA